MKLDPKSLVRRLSPTATRALEAAVGRAASGQVHEIVPLHLLQALLEPGDSEASQLLQEFGADRSAVLARLARAIERLNGAASGRPVFSQSLFNWLRDAWLEASVERGALVVRSGALLATFADDPSRYTPESFPELENLPHARLRRELDQLLSATHEAAECEPTLPPGARADAGGPKRGGDALARYTHSFTQAARDGRIDPVLGRHREIGQLITILARRRKNNPMIVGEPGVGKTALVEGLARAIVEEQVPETLRGVEVVGLDMGALQAGASVKGEFENRLKSVIAEVKASVPPIVLFIDEAHTLIGAGGAAGTGDAANLLKPELARGELRTIGATTWAEFKKYFEKDAALERRFQPVAVDEPSEEQAIAILRGLKPTYEAAHGVAIQDEAVVACVKLSSRYISGRQLPDKAVDLLDSTAARVKVELRAVPERLADLRNERAELERTQEALRRDLAVGHPIDHDELARVERRLEASRGELASTEERYEVERASLARVLEARAKATAEGGSEAAKAELAAALDAHAELCGENPLIHGVADASAVARVVHAWTGIPVGSLKADTIRAALDLEERLKQRVKGQDHAMATVAETVRMSQAGIAAPDAPVGVLLFVGTSGVGKTETALALADLLYGGERFLTSINMSEFQEKHTVSRLIGSPPGYVGYGEGGVLSEAVRQRPYSVVLLDECEKADPDVMNLFYQVFDKGVLNDGEGRRISFRNTLIILTSNLATPEIEALHRDGHRPCPEEVARAIRPTLSRHFKPALLARMTIVPFAPMAPDVLQEIAGLKLQKLTRRLEEAHRVQTTIDDGVLHQLAARCREAETGARNLDHILRGSLMPQLARELLGRLAEGQAPRSLRIALQGDAWRLHFE